MLDIVLCFKTSSPSTMVATIVACATISMSSCRKSQSNTVMLAIFQLMFLVISFLVSKVIKFCKICKAKHTFLTIFDDFETKIAYFASRRLKNCKKNQTTITRLLFMLTGTSPLTSWLRGRTGRMGRMFSRFFCVHIHTHVRGDFYNLSAPTAPCAPKITKTINPKQTKQHEYPTL